MRSIRGTSDNIIYAYIHSHANYFLKVVPLSTVIPYFNPEHTHTQIVVVVNEMEITYLLLSLRSVC